tara:strand:+ start:66 stop:887 length:822 start_codon:yes stop_codon:yes gene_type:complete
MAESYTLTGKTVNKGRLTYSSEETTNINLGQRGFDIMTSIGVDETPVRAQEVRLKVFRFPQTNGPDIYRAFRNNNISMVAQPSGDDFQLTAAGVSLEVKDVDTAANPVVAGDYVLIQGYLEDSTTYGDIEVVKVRNVNTTTNVITITDDGRGQLGTTARLHDFHTDGSSSTQTGATNEFYQYWVMMPGECTHWTTIKNMSGSIEAEVQADTHQSAIGSDFTADASAYLYANTADTADKWVSIAPGDTITGCFRTIQLMEPDAEATTSLYCLRG